MSTGLPYVDEHAITIAVPRMYRALVIGTRAHVLATRHMLRTVRRLSSRTAEEGPDGAAGPDAA